MTQPLLWLPVWAGQRTTQAVDDAFLPAAKRLHPLPNKVLRLDQGHVVLGVQSVFQQGLSLEEA